MTCADYEAELDADLDGALTSERRARFEAHAAACARCRALAARARSVARALAELPVPPPAPGFEARVLGGARSVRRPPRIVAAGFVAAFALSVLTLIYTGLMVGPPRRDAVEALPVVRMALDERRTVNLVFAAPMPLEDVSLQLVLPPGIELRGYEGRRRVRWSTKLEAGNNVLPLDLLATDTIGGRLTARLLHDGTEKVFRIEVAVTEG